MEFEWDERKAALNYQKHNLSFLNALQVFLDPDRIVFEDKRRDYGEDRFVIIGKIEVGIITVIFTDRAGKTRIISARRASPNEREKYRYFYT